MKVCIECNLELDDVFFKKYTRKRCIDCYRNYYREYESKNRERIRNRQENIKRKMFQVYKKKEKNIER